MQRTRDTRGRGAPRRAGLPREVFTVLPKSGRETGESEPRGSAGQGGARARKRARLGGRAGRVLGCGPEHPALLEAGLASRRAPAPTRAPATSATACDVLSVTFPAGGALSTWALAPRASAPRPRSPPWRLDSPATGHQSPACGTKGARIHGTFPGVLAGTARNARVLFR